MERIRRSEKKNPILLVIDAMTVIAFIAAAGSFLVPTPEARVPEVTPTAAASSWIASCWNEEGMQQYVPTTQPTQEIPPEAATEIAIVQEDRHEQIQATQSAMQNSREQVSSLEQMDPAYMDAVVRYELTLPGASYGEPVWIPVLGGSAMIVGTGYETAEGTEEKTPLWILLTNNHTIPDDLKEWIEIGGSVGIMFRGVDEDRGKVDDTSLTTRLAGCRDIVSNGQHVATLLAVRGEPGSPLFAEAFGSFPAARVGGPCSVETDMRVVSFPTDGSNGMNAQPLLSVVHGPYEWDAGYTLEGVYTEHYTGRGLVNSGSSGGSLLDGNGKVCGIVNYMVVGDNSLVGFNELPDAQFMQEQITQFLAEQITR